MEPRSRFPLRYGEEVPFCFGDGDVVGGAALVGELGGFFSLVTFIIK